MPESKILPHERSLEQVKKRSLFCQKKVNLSKVILKLEQRKYQKCQGSIFNGMFIVKKTIV